jgi:hypothetical protein
MKLVDCEGPSYTYCNRFDKRVARQQLCKRRPTRNNLRGIIMTSVFYDIYQAFTRWYNFFYRN